MCTCDSFMHQLAIRVIPDLNHAENEADEQMWEGLREAHLELQQVGDVGFMWLEDPPHH